MGKRCNRGISCGATCIDGQKICELNFPTQVSSSLSKVRDVLVKMRDAVLSEYKPLVTPEETAKWLLENKEELATWGMTEFKLNEAIAQRPAYITFGVEPGVAGGGGDNDALPALRESIKALKNAPEIRDKGKGTTGPWGDLILKANTYKLVMEGSPKVKDIVPNMDPKTNILLKGLATMGMNPNKAAEQEGMRGLIMNSSVSWAAPKRGLDADLAKAASKSTQLNWGLANGLISRGAGISGQGATFFNPSGLWKPSKNYGQFAPLFEKAGYSKSEMGPFASNGAWYKYSSEKMGDQVMRIVREAQPKLMYFGGSESARVRDRISQEFPKHGEFTLKALTKDGTKTVSKRYEYFLYPRPDGTHTVAMFGPHPGAMGMLSNRNIMEGTGEVAKALHETGELPERIPHGTVS